MYQIELLNFLNLVVKEDLRFCILCWKTSKERTLVDTKNLVTFLETVENKVDKFTVQGLAICCYCNSHVKRAIQLLRNWSTSSQLIAFMQSIKRTEINTVFRAIDKYGTEKVPDNLSLQKWRHSTVLFCNSRISVMRNFSELVALTTLLLDTDEETLSAEGLELVKVDTDTSGAENKTDVVLIENSFDSAIKTELVTDPVYKIEDDPLAPPPTPTHTAPAMTVHPLMLPPTPSTTIDVSAQLNAVPPPTVILSPAIPVVTYSYQFDVPPPQTRKLLVVQTNERLVAHPVVCERDLCAVPSLDCKLLDNVLIPLSVSERASLPAHSLHPDAVIVNHINTQLIARAINSGGMPMFQVDFSCLARFIPTDDAVTLHDRILCLNNTPSPSPSPIILDNTRRKGPRPEPGNNKRRATDRQPPVPQPLQTSIVDWEVKIPMDVISYKDAVDPCPDQLVADPPLVADVERARPPPNYSSDIVEID